MKPQKVWHEILIDGFSIRVLVVIVIGLTLGLALHRVVTTIASSDYPAQAQSAR